MYPLNLVTTQHDIVLLLLLIIFIIDIFILLGRRRSCATIGFANFNAVKGVCIITIYILLLRILLLLLYA